MSPKLLLLFSLSITIYFTTELLRLGHCGHLYDCWRFDCSSQSIVIFLVTCPIATQLYLRTSGKDDAARLLTVMFSSSTQATQ